MARLVVISAPSGAGKTTVIAEALRLRPQWRLSVSYTTRAPRPGEVDGVDYHFVTPQEFEEIGRAGGFLETAEVHGSWYGTPRAPVEEALAEDATMLLEIDVQGADAVSRQVPEAVRVFIEPPSWDVLEARLSGRGTESEAAVKRRLANARGEMAAAGRFQHRIVNDRLEDAVGQLIGIIEGPSGPSAGPPPKENA